MAMENPPCSIGNTNLQTGPLLQCESTFVQGQTLVPYQCVVRRADWEQMRTSFLEDAENHAQWEYVCRTIIVYLL